ncbi:hypothetical protein P3102_35405 [Amycolatopsis sp. QT-25]|uniref:hypothetical protein n=1 Tax=Amycolatopsis sp. QT-25 TaxID=3034022 RepID=UPI0023ECED4D|nr:hypothetical protein [Amycolatopsis sp. QT-25]WET79258.1 hypothetical protein P3102_35405 [Amycolatopsis sp. QT-25]
MTTAPRLSSLDGSRGLREKFARAMYERNVPGARWDDIVNDGPQRVVKLYRGAAAAAVDVWGDSMAETVTALVKLTDETKAAQAQLLAADGLLETLFGYLANGERGHPGEAARRTGWISQRRIDELGARLRAWRASWAVS